VYVLVSFHISPPLTNFCFQTMGFGLPAAIGAKVAAPKKIVVDVDGDASFSMTAMELATASQYGIGVKVLILNNEFQGMVLQWQGTLIFVPFPFEQTLTSHLHQICSTRNATPTPV
jgi:thiamine pyrophosphate-dependent acetolactate synthase large subunit-like protein